MAGQAPKKAASKTVVAAGTAKRTPARKPKIPAFWAWMAEQHTNLDPQRAAAATFIATRWSFNEFYNHSRVVRTLRREDSEHLVGAQLLAEDYANFYGLTAVDRIGVSGLASPLFPEAPRTCTEEGCYRQPPAGSDLCNRHGAHLLSGADRERIAEAVADRLIGLSERAVGVLEDLLDHGRSEKVRFDAAVAVLDRVGVGPTSTLRIDPGEPEGDGRPTPAQVIAERLDRLSDAALTQLEASARGLEPEEIEILDAQLVDDDDPVA